MANNIVQVKRTNTAGRTPNTTGSYATNSQYIDAGELALNMADGILYTSNGSALIEIGANNTNQRITNSLTINNSRNLNFQTTNTSAAVYFTQQNDDNFVFYSTNTAYGARPVWGIFANSITSNLQFYAPIQLNSGLVANGGLGTAGQVLTTNGTTTYWSSVGGSGTVTSVGSGNGLTGGPITGSGTLSVLANNGITSNSSGVFAVSGIGTIVNSTGINVNANNGITATISGVFVNGNNGLTVNSTGVHVLANTGIIANSTGTFVNWAAPSVIGSTTANGAVFTYANVTGQVNTATLFVTTSANVGTAFVANSVGVTTTGFVNATTVVNSAAHTVGTSFVANSIGVTTTGFVNATSVVNSGSFTVGTTFTANSTLVNAAAINVTGRVNTATFFATTSANIGTAFVANTVQITITGVPLSANGNVGTQGHILYSNGSTGSPYWAAAATGSSVNTAATYTWTNDHFFTANVSVGNSTSNDFFTAGFGMSNPNNFSGGTITTPAGFNTVIVGPFSISAGNSVIISSGSRLVIL